MSDIPQTGEAFVRRSIHRPRSLVLAHGDFSYLIAAYREHVKIWSPEPDGLTEMLVRQGLAASALHLTSRPRDESMGITLNLKSPPINLFLAGAASDGSVTARFFTEDVKTAEASRFFVQSSRPGQPPVLSAIAVSGLDVLEIFEQYYEQSQQLPTRFFELADDEFAMVQGLPGADPAGIRSLTREEAAHLAEDDGIALDERVFRFHCGCNPQKILTALRGIFADGPEDLFRGDEEVEAFCPRCGRRWRIRRESF
jgi:molecular chaperone Hsp33